MARIGRPPSCECGTCKKCRTRDARREAYQALTLEERRAIIAARDPEKVKQADRDRYYRQREQRLQAMKRWPTEHPERVQEFRLKWLSANPEKRAAQILVGNAIRDGRISRMPCEVCGVTGKKNGRSLVHAHHDDYSKPLEVRWLCTQHHNEYHRKYPVRVAS